MQCEGIWSYRDRKMKLITFTLYVTYFIPAHLLQCRIGTGPKWIVLQEQQQCRTFSQFLFQEAGLCSWRLQPLKDSLMVFKHPTTDGFWCEVTFPSRENLTEEKIAEDPLVHIQKMHTPITKKANYGNLLRCIFTKHMVILNLNSSNISKMLAQGHDKECSKNTHLQHCTQNVH